MIGLYLSELLEPGIRELLEGEELVSLNGDGDYEDISLFIVQDGHSPPLAKLREVAPVLVLSSHPIQGQLSLDCYGEELLEAIQAALTSPWAEREEVKLSRREREVLELIAEEGWLTASQIGERLGIGRRYVYNVCTRLYGKLGVEGEGPIQTRVEALRRAREMGLI